MINNNAKNAVLGALVADAASMGLHWLYDQSKIKELAPHSPEFRSPHAGDYENVMGYFAHPKKQAGDLSQYGEQLFVMLRCLAENEGHYAKARYQTAFCEHFGYGGSYIGYIDRATRDTLNNVAKLESAASEQALSIPFAGADDVKSRLMNKIMSCSKFASGDALRTQVEQAVRITDDSDANVAHAFKMIDAWESVSGYPGSNDVQLPAIAKLPALVAFYAGKPELSEVAESAIKVTHNNDEAIAFGLAVTHMIETAILTGDPQESIRAGMPNGNTTVSSLLTDSLSMSDKSNNEVTQHFGMACDLAYGVPSVAHNVVTASSFEQAIRNNIYAGGDSCGRSILLGAVMGACYGVGGESGIPEAWIKRLSAIDAIQALIQ